MFQDWVGILQRNIFSFCVFWINEKVESGIHDVDDLNVFFIAISTNTANYSVAHFRWMFNMFVWQTNTVDGTDCDCTVGSVQDENINYTTLSIQLFIFVFNLTFNLVVSFVE